MCAVLGSRPAVADSVRPCLVPALRMRQVLQASRPPCTVCGARHCPRQPLASANSVQSLVPMLRVRPMLSSQHGAAYMKVTWRQGKERGATGSFCPIAQPG